jgi:hypothetical protein
MLFFDMNASFKKPARPSNSHRSQPSAPSPKNPAPSDIYRVPSKPKAIPPRVNGRRVEG